MRTDKSYYPGKHKVICQRCGITRYDHDCAREPKTNFFVCKDTCYDELHPQDRPIYGLGERQSVQDHFPETMSTINSQNAYVWSEVDVIDPNNPLNNTKTRTLIKDTQPEDL